MSSLANLNPAQSVPTAESAAAGNPFAELQSTDFVRIMVEELSNQDPFEPNDSAAILDQLSSLRSIESDLKLQSQFESLVLQNAIGQAGALIGREVEGLSLDNETIRGTVTSVRVVDGATEVELEDGQRLAMDRITRVSELEATTAAPAAVAATSVAAPVTPVSVADAVAAAASSGLDPEVVREAASVG